MVHSDPLGFNDAVSWESKISDAIDGYLRTATEIPAKISAKGTSIPQFNLALMWCCDTLSPVGGVDTRHSASLNLLNRVDAAYAGFADTVATWLKAGDRSPQLPSACNDPLCLHGKKVLELLANGKTLSEALAAANDAYPPRQIVISGSCPVLDMTIKGDSRTKIVNVYLSETEWIDYPGARTTWFVVFN